MAFAWRSLLCLRCIENPIWQHTKREGRKVSFISSPSWICIFFWLYTEEVVTEVFRGQVARVVFYSLNVKYVHFIFFLPLNRLSGFFWPSSSSISWLVIKLFGLWNVLGLLFCSSIVISRKIPQTRLHSLLLYLCLNVIWRNFWDWLTSC